MIVLVTASRRVEFGAWWTIVMLSLALHPVSAMAKPPSAKATTRKATVGGAKPTSVLYRVPAKGSFALSEICPGGSKVVYTLGPQQNPNTRIGPTHDGELAITKKLGERTYESAGGCATITPPILLDPGSEITCSFDGNEKNECSITVTPAHVN